MNLKELSTILGLSQTTVSRALNGYPEVSEETRIKVQKAAEKHNYRPNTKARSLATGRSMAIGHVIPVSTKHEMVNPIFGDFISGAGEVYSKHGYDMVLTVVEDKGEEAAYRQMQSRGSVDGVVVHGPLTTEPRIDFLRKIGLPFAVHGRASGENSDYNWVDINNRRAFHRATDFLLDLGHRRIAFINGLEYMDFAYRRREGFIEAMTERGVAYDPALMFSNEMTEDYGYETAMTLLRGENAPTAFLVSSMICALGVRRAIEDLNMKMGRDVSIITHDDVLSYMPNGKDLPIFTSTRSSVRQAGSLVAETLLAQIADPLRKPQHQLLEAELMVGQSTGPVKA
ncbi:LacI family transcriptional regulator [Marivivens niveibacter]|uniref:LacI family transcriptional regulator n=1 Tax=Marivivens niveibacter TaxID=1930667 RepID=A0A251X3W6_9RHOB|nr:substrate-binding domain-containing protein [Marivivens niveibacter]OUD11068.1 LacI family transcriptional regulator [Marivivens niveibacter]